jgi:hypothetical protein
MPSHQLIHDWIANRLSLGLDFHQEAGQSPEASSIVFKNAELVLQWAAENGPNCLFASISPLKRPVGGHSVQVVLSFSPPSDIDGKVMYFMRMAQTEISIELLTSGSCVVYGDLPSSCLDVFRDQLQNEFSPLVQVTRAGKQQNSDAF